MRDLHLSSQPAVQMPQVYPRTYGPQSLLKINAVNHKNQNLENITDQEGGLEGIRSHVLSRDIKECRWLEYG